MMADTSGNLKPGDIVRGVFQNFELDFKVSENQPTGPNVSLKHDRGEVHVRKQDIRNGEFELDVKRRP
jgi:hypothetical protein